MSDITRLLAEVGANPNKEASDALLSAVYEELRIIARAKMANERPGHTLQPTILVNDAWLKLFPDGKTVQFNSRAHFFGTAAEVMRRMLVDHARARIAQKRGGGAHKTQLSTELFGEIEIKASDELVVAVDEVLNQIRSNDPETAKIVEMRFFLDMTMPEVAATLEISLSAAERAYRDFKRKHADKFRDLI